MVAILSPIVSDHTQIYEWNGSSWVVKIPRTDIEPWVGDSRILGISQSKLNNEDLFLITQDKIHKYTRNSYDSTFEFPATIANDFDVNIPEGSAIDGSNGIYIAGRRKLYYFEIEDHILNFGWDYRTGKSRSRICSNNTTKHFVRGDSNFDINVSSYGGVSGLAHDGTSLYFGDRNTSRILKVNPTTKAISNFKRLPDRIPGGSVKPNVDSMAYGDGRIWIGDDRNKKIVSFDLTGGDTRVDDLPVNTTPTGIAHTGEAGTLPYAIGLF